MKNISLHSVYLVAITLLTPWIVNAQERTAGGSLQTEASWSALKNLIDKVQGDTTINKIDINAIKSCASQGKLYAGSGCQDVAIPTDPRVTSIIDCGNQGKVYSADQHTCIKVTGSNRWTYSRSGPTGGTATHVKNAFTKMGIPLCSNGLNTLAKTCTTLNTECGAIGDTSERGCSSDGNKTCYDTSSEIYICN
jgi:hypothetical protein